MSTCAFLANIILFLLILHIIQGIVYIIRTLTFTFKKHELLNFWFFSFNEAFIWLFGIITFRIKLVQLFLAVKLDFDRAGILDGCVFFLFLEALNSRLWKLSYVSSKCWERSKNDFWRKNNKFLTRSRSESVLGSYNFWYWAV